MQWKTGELVGPIICLIALVLFLLNPKANLTGWAAGIIWWGLVLVYVICQLPRWWASGRARVRRRRD